MQGYEKWRMLSSRTGFALFIQIHSKSSAVNFTSLGRQKNLDIPHQTI
jgi:hypothetical protein